MYDYRNWPTAKQQSAIQERLSRGFPEHRPPHVGNFEAWRLITAACFEHRHILSGPERLGWFEEQLTTHLERHSIQCTAWVVLPNHYHVLVRISDWTSSFKPKVSFMAERHLK